MKIISVDLNKDFSEAVSVAVAVLRGGGVIVFPTDTVYSLGANVCNDWAVESVFKIKNRSLNKPLPIFARNMNWVKEMAFVPAKLEPKLEEIWPGATTIILPKKEIIPKIVTAGHKTVGIRIPDSLFIDKILGKFGYPITATSANISGEEPAGSIKKVIEYFEDRVWKPDLIIDAGKLPPSQPSIVVDMSNVRPKILRVGPSRPEQLMKLLGLSD